MQRTVISTTDAPAAAGPYSQAIRLGDLVFVSGMLPLDPASGEKVEGGIDAQTRRALDNMKAVLTAAGSSMDRVVKTTIYLQHISDFPILNGIYGEYFPKEPPARATIAASALPRGVLVEIDAIAGVG